MKDDSPAIRKLEKKTANQDGVMYFADWTHGLDLQTTFKHHYYLATMYNLQLEVEINISQTYPQLCGHQQVQRHVNLLEYSQNYIHTEEGIY